MPQFTDRSAWQSLFVGRESELGWLQDAWRDAQAGKPQLRVLRGESGLGKTKIVQEFYAWLSRSDVADPGEYWPDQLLQGDNLRLNPDLAKQQLGDDLQYLWWGVRWSSPEARNLSELTHCALFDQRSTLQPHWNRLSAFKDSAVAALKLSEKLGTSAFELAKDAAVSLFPVLGLIQTVAALGQAASDIGRATRELGEELDRYHKSPAQREVEELTEQIEQIVAFLSWVLKPFHRSGSGALPVVLILDDAQWMDSRSLSVIRDLFSAARAGEWPLLVVATHWEREWHEQIEAAFHSDVDEASGESNSPACFATLFQQLLDLGAGCGLFDVEKLSHQDVVFRTAFPGLTTGQLDYLVQRADGNASLLHEIVLYLEQEPSLFVEGDFSAPLNDIAFEELDEDLVRFDLHRLQERRYKRLADEIQELLALASLEGVQFLAELVEEVAVQLSLGSKDAYRGALDRAVSPHAILSSSGAEYEFRFLIFHEFAHRFASRLARRRGVTLEDFHAVLHRTAVRWLGSVQFADLIDLEKDRLVQMSLQSVESEAGETNARNKMRVLLWAIDHYGQTGNFRLAVEHAAQWQAILPVDVIPFDAQHSSISVDRLLFYPAHIVFSITDYSAMPELRLRYISDGEEVRLLDGTPRPLQWAVESGFVRVEPDTALGYLRFFLAQLKTTAETGIWLVEAPDPAANTAYSPELRAMIVRHYSPVTVTSLSNTGHQRVEGLLTNGNSLFHASFDLSSTGVITLNKSTTMLSMPVELQAGRETFVLEDVLDFPAEKTLSEEHLQHLVSHAVRVLAVSPETESLVTMAREANLNTRLRVAQTEFTHQPRAGLELFVGMPAYSVTNLPRLVLLVADVLLQYQLTQEGLPQPELTLDKEDYIEQAARRMSRKIAVLCMFAFSLSEQEELSEYDFISEMHALEHGQVMDVFLANV